MIDHYAWRGGREAMLRFGAVGERDRPVVLILPALFEEHNRTRAFTVAIARALAGVGIASVLPDLPGQNESALPTELVTLDDWRAAMAALSESLDPCPVHIAAIRGGAMLGAIENIRSVWRLAPVTGHAVLRDLRRAASAGSDGDDTTFAGNALGPALIAALESAVDLPTLAVPVRTARVGDDPGNADVRFSGAPLWRRSEPATDETLSQLIAADIAVWIARCGG